MQMIVDKTISAKSTLSQNDFIINIWYKFAVFVPRA